jgi:DNA-binding beta-propeller fold protein YncE
LPRATRLSADGKWAYVLDFDQQTIWALDTADNSVVGTLDVGGHLKRWRSGRWRIPLCHILSGWHCLRHPNGAAEAQGGGKVMHWALRFFAASTC